MRKFRKLKFVRFFLLLLYILSNSPSDFFHHHEHSIVAYEHADDCEKSIYYSNSADACHHKQHVSKELEKCSLCDHHTSATHTIFQAFTARLTVAFSIEQSFYAFHFSTVYHAGINNRGPPNV